MKKSYQECLEQIKSEHKDLYPIWYIDNGNKYIFNMLKRGVDREEAMSNFYIVDASTGISAGPIPVMEIYGNDKLAAKLDNPHKIDPEDQQIEHGFLKNDYPVSYRVRRMEPVSQDDDLQYGGYLSHHGILGQKWGRRNGPPYPLKPSAHSKAEKAAAKSKGRNSGSSDSNKKAVSIGSFEETRQRSREKKAIDADKWLESATMDLSHLIDRDATKKGGMDEGTVSDAIWALFDPVSAISLATRAAIGAYENGKVKRYMKNREKNGEVDSKTGLYLKKDNSEQSEEKADKADLAAVNPAVHNMNANTKNNCMLCTTTYDLRKRGYDVTAQLDSQGYNFHDLKKWYPKAKIEKTTRYGDDGKALDQKGYAQKTIKNILKQGDGARGNMMVQFKQGGGHSIIYEVKNGQVVFKDGQVNQVYKNPEKFLMRTSVNAFARLDNVEPNMKEIKKYCVR